MNQTILLDREKTIDVGKIIHNEQILHQENELLKQAVEALENALEQSQAQLDLLRGEYRHAQARIADLQQGIIDNKQELLEIERSRRPSGLFGYVEGGLGADNYDHLFIGVKWAKEKMIYSFSVNPINDQTIYAIGLGVKIF